MTRIKFNAAAPDLDGLRQAIFERMRRQPDWKGLDSDPVERFAQFVELTPPRRDDRQVFESSILEVFWQLTVEGIVAPGVASSPLQMGFPRFSVTSHGQRVLADREYIPHDRRGYVELLRQRVATPDQTVLAYLNESLETYAAGNLVASTIMLGVAAERVFDLVCESALKSLKDDAERKTFSNLLDRTPMKPKLDWLFEKLRRLQDAKPRLAGYPENVVLMVTAIYDLIRTQRNDFGHPSEAPPKPSRSQAYANLLMFPPFYERAEALRKFLASEKI